MRVIKVVLVNIFLTLTLLMAIEIYLLGSDDRTIAQYLTQYGHFKYHQMSFWTMQPKVSPGLYENRLRNQWDQEIIQNKDHLYRRYTPNQPQKSDRFFIVMGDSFTWGDGLNDNETISAALQTELGENFKVYNYGQAGSQPGVQLARLINSEISEEIEQVKGIVVFTLNSAMLPRVIPDPTNYSYVYGHPNFEVKSGNLRLLGSHYDNEPLHILRYWFSHTLLFPRLWQLVDGQDRGERDMMCYILREIDRKISSSFEQVEFNLSLYPQEGHLELLTPECIEHFDGRILNFSNVVRPKEMLKLHPDGWHPSGKENQWYAQMLINKLKLNK